MNSTEFLKEDTQAIKEVLKLVRLSDDQAVILLGVVEQIKLHCQPFLNEVEDPFSLLRGLHATNEWAVNRPVRLENRKPMSSPQKLHDEINFIMRKKFGAEFRNSLFCTGAESMAHVYGMPFAIFPVGDYEYLWSPKYRDLYTAYDIFRVNHDKRHFVQQLDWDAFQDDKLNAAIHKGGEIMVRCKNYYGLNMNHIHIDKNGGPLMNAVQEYWMQ